MNTEDFDRMDACREQAYRELLQSDARKTVVEILEKAETSELECLLHEAKTDRYSPFNPAVLRAVNGMIADRMKWSLPKESYEEARNVAIRDIFPPCTVHKNLPDEINDEFLHDALMRQFKKIINDWCSDDELTIALASLARTNAGYEWLSERKFAIYNAQGSQS